MPCDPVTLRTDVIEKSSFGEHDVVNVTQHESPCDDEGNAVEDPYMEADLLLAKRCKEWLDKTYPRRMWHVIADLKQGIVRFNIPLLMGFKHWWVVNLRKTDLADGLVEGSGQILERYGLSREWFDAGDFLSAREKFSKMIVPSRPIPG